jgi:molecular chaperone GrpE
VTIWHFIYFGNTFANKKSIKKISTMSHENTDLNPEIDPITAENTVEETPVNQEELSPEAQMAEDLEKEKDKFLRLFAEFENYKRRTAKERLELYKTANQDVLQAMLPVMDDFDRALIEIKKTDDDVLLKGVELIHEKLKNTLMSKGLEAVEIKAGDIFNADFAEAITQIPAPSPNFKGKIVDVIEKGYKLGDKIIRFPKVVIGQ